MRQRGFILVTSLIFLVLMTLLGLSLFGSLNTNQTISSNFREKQRAEDAAQAALVYAQHWLSYQVAATPLSPPQGVTCTSGTVGPAVCLQAFPSPAPAWPWTTTTVPGATAYPPAPTPMPGTYSNNPMYYIRYLYQQSSGLWGGTLTCPCYFYQITAAASGGNANAVSVIQSVYVFGSTQGSRGN